MKKISISGLIVFWLLMCGGNSWSKPNEGGTLKYGVMSESKISGVLEVWQPFIAYLEKNLDKKISIEVFQRQSLLEKSLSAGRVDFAYVNSLASYRMQKKNSTSPVALIENTKGEIYSRSKFLVRNDSGIKNETDLRGKSLAYISASNTGGYLAPRAFLLKSGVEAKEVFTNNIASSIYKVLLGDLDAAAICGISFRLMSRKIETGDLKIIATSEKYPEGIIVTRSGLAADFKKRLSETLIDMDSVTAGRTVLDGMASAKINRFVSYQPDVEQVIEKLLKEARL